MNWFSRRILALLAGLVLITASAALVPYGRGFLSLPERMVKDTAGLAERLVSGPYKTVRSWWLGLFELRDTFEENRKLKMALDSLIRIKAEYDLLQQENEKLRGLLDFQSKAHDYTLYSAEVIGRDVNTWDEVLVLNRGEKDGLMPGMAVITDKGLIGIIDAVSTFTSNVRLLGNLSTRQHIAVMTTSRERSFGVIENYDSENGLLIMGKMPLDTEVHLGETVVTSGLGGLLPPGLPVGTVEKVRPGRDMLTRNAWIRPFDPAKDVSAVFVVKRNDGYTGEGVGP
ncbi:MAG: rod shape-determining protein MreC [Candidatus Carbobacillus altaicus]|nr:rod shape-determining protein MreC [Candidatus Carbobacillus altaicus]